MNSPKHSTEYISAINVKQTSDEVYKFNFSTNDGEKNSWWYIFCLKCRQKEVGPGWEPGCWPKTCPHPYCPSFRHVARILALLITVTLCWGVVLAVMGSAAKPGGQLFSIAVLVVFAYLGGWVFRMLTLPALVGMLLVGIIYKNVGLIEVDEHYKEFVSILRKIALVVIFTRAGLDLDPVALKKLYCRVLFLALIPWCTEAAVIAVTVHYLLSLPWKFAILCGSIIAAVAPAVVVPCLFRLRTKGYGVAKGIPTLIIAVAGIDDAASVIAFGVGTKIIFGKNPVTYDLMLSPLSIAVGILYGVVWGFIVKYVPERTDPYVVPLRILMLTGGGLLAVLGFEIVHLEGAGPLAVIISSFTSIYFWTKQGWNIEDNPVATAFEIFWMIFEPILFGLTGTQIILNELDLAFVTAIVMCVVIAFVSRILITIIAASGSSLNFKEKLFIALSWMAKASVQAALGPAVLEVARSNNQDEEYSKTIVMVCIISILLTAPAGAIIVSLSGPKLLTKAKPSNEQWRRGPRPSIRDITLNSEDEDNGTSVSNDQGQECDGVKADCTAEVQSEKI
ncbi:sodium/hydrogen exchanger 9B1 isoform X2 [Acyrthosiphon pisum]|uniref:Cation/H+ exchanger transmembrane domain-containing protein n=1 Tax=Acyrthosiphon pisum TaxID=7029 RepID=A0A8R1W2A6_ACYPI|nr:sodium/hydrogen exchanger 9B1 isoform X2 [Acyrthosiphon pisum]|eukprot:XP_001946407.2 PREDICTED: sodium/hydrogen exchanger 9B1 isoform X2 [Acyrthosiphon pisum]